MALATVGLQHTAAVSQIAGQAMKPQTGTKASVRQGKLNCSHRTPPAARSDWND